MKIDGLTLTGKSLEILGWVHIRDKVSNGRLLVDYGILTAGVALDEGKAKIHLSKPRKWFEEQLETVSERAAEPAVPDRS
jgi:hypothetical protein